MVNVTVVPAILSTDIGEIKEKLTRLTGAAEWVHLDVADGAFVDNETWRDAAAVGEMHTDIQLEIHLMVQTPLHEVEPWARAGAKRLVAHIEAFDDHDSVDTFIVAVHDAGRVAGLAVNASTPAERIIPFLPHLDVVQFMGYEPGFSGALFDERVTEKVRAFHTDHPEVIISVDGAMNPERAAVMAQAGASIIISNSAFWRSGDANEAIQAFYGKIEGETVNDEG